MRSDDDTWDILTSVGSTALFVATARAMEARKPDPLAVDAFAERFCRAVGPWPGADVLTGTEFGACFVDFQAARTRFFDDYFGRAAEAGITQIVLLAAGLDSRAYRLPWAPQTTVYELDQPRILEFKREALAGVTPTAQRREVAVDLRDDWPTALTEAGFDPDRPSAWLAEGLLIYLPAAAQEQLFIGIDALACSGSRVGIEEIAPMPADIFAAKRDEELAAGMDASFFTLVYNEQHAPAEQWFGAHGWTAEATGLTRYLRQAGRSLPAQGTEERYMLDSASLVSGIKS